MLSQLFRIFLVVALFVRSFYFFRFWRSGTVHTVTPQSRKAPLALWVPVSASSLLAFSFLSEASITDFQPGKWVLRAFFDLDPHFL